jgi:D-aminopeptidase
VSTNLPRPRARALGLPFPGTPGSFNAITDVAGVLVGYETLSSHADATLARGGLPVQTGVTAVLPRGFEASPRPVWAGQFTLNGNGEMTGTHWVRDGGYFVGPVMITNTHSVGMVHHGATRWMLEHYAAEWQDRHLWAMPVVAETYDGVLSDINGLHVTAEHALNAIRSARSGPLAEGNVGGGTGMVCYEFKGGTGTASRLVEVDRRDFTLGALVQANHGLRPLADRTRRAGGRRDDGGPHAGLRG